MKGKDTMRWWWRSLISARTLLRRGHESQCLDTELQYHLDQQIAENIAAGMVPEEARYTAIRAFGNPALLREQTRAAWSWNWLELFFHDLRYAARALRHSPGFAITALLTLTLAIGANTAIFSLLNALLLRSLPVHDPQRLVALKWDLDNWPDDQLVSSGYSDYEFSYPAFKRFGERKEIFSSLFGFAALGFDRGNLAVTVRGDTTPATATMVTGSYFSGLGINSVVGRMLSETDLQPSAPRAAVISYAYWQSRFAGSPSAVGESVKLNGRPYTIVGVAARGFTGLQPGVPDDLWIPVIDDKAIRPWQSDPPPGQSMFASHQWWWLTIAGRLNPGIKPQQAQVALEPELASEVRESTGTATAPTPGKQLHFQIVPGDRGLQYIQNMYEKPAGILMALVVLVLLAACANLATRCSRN